jgi:hypothetical protein
LGGKCKKIPGRADAAREIFSFLTGKGEKVTFGGSGEMPLVRVGFGEAERRG